MMMRLGKVGAGGYCYRMGALLSSKPQEKGKEDVGASTYYREGRPRSVC